MDATQTRLYLSGPIKGFPDAPDRFADAARALEEAGYAPLNPFDVPAICKPPCRGEQDTDRHYDCFMRGDLAAMVACDGVALLPDGEASKGVRIEHSVALQVGMPARSVDAWLAADPSLSHGKAPE